MKRPKITTMEQASPEGAKPCQCCRCVERTPFTVVNAMEHDGQRIKWRGSRCAKCQQYRVDRIATPLRG